MKLRSSCAVSSAPRSEHTSGSKKLRPAAVTLQMAAVVLAALQIWAFGGATSAAFAQAGTSGLRTPPGATTYSTTRRIFNVGILLIDSTINLAEAAKGPENPDPYVFYIADQRVDLKPQNWEFVNPLAPATVTDAIKARWDARAGGNSGYTIGQKVTKDMACYWEVPLTTTPTSDLLKYDLLFVTNHRSTKFTPSDRELLRKLVDAGGIFWMEDCGNMRIDGGTTAASGSFFLSDVQFEGSGFGNFTTSGPQINVPNHPILTSPYQLSLTEIANLGDKNYGTFAMGSYVNSTTAGAAQPDPETLINIVGNTNTSTRDANGVPLPYIAAGNYGSGSVLLTSGDSGCDINDNCGGTQTPSGGNSGPFGGQNFIAAHTEDLKFLYNIVNWGSSNTSYRRNDRRSASSYETMSAPLLPDFNFASLSRANDIVNSSSTPLLVNGLMYVSGLDATGKVTVRAYDTHPQNDYDGDGNSDDGLTDLALGLQYDEIWRYQGGAAGTGTPAEQPSSPVYATVNVSSGGNSVSYTAKNFIYVTEPSGQLDILQANPAVNGRLAATQLAPITVPPDGDSNSTYDVTATHGIAPAPVSYGNLVFQVEPDGLVRCIDGRTGTIEWNSFDLSQAAPYSIVPTGTPTLGFSQLSSDTTVAKNSGKTTNDLMLYVPAAVQQIAGGTTVGQILAYWVGTRNEVQHQFNGDAKGQSGLMPMRVAGGAGSPTGVSAQNQAPLYIANGPQAAVGAMASAGSPFTTPIIRGVFSPTYGPDPTAPPLITAQENYAAGNISADYTATWDTSDSPQFSGYVQVTQTNPGNASILPPGSGPNHQHDILVAVDYDVSYLVPKGSDLPQSSAAQITVYNNSALNKIGVLSNTNLNIQSYAPKAVSEAGNNNFPNVQQLGVHGSGLDTATLSTDDLLIFSADQQFQTPFTQNANTSPNVTSVYAIHAQPDQASTQLKWRFGLHDTGKADGTVNGQSITDYAPIFNYLLFNPSTSITALIGTVEATPEFISSLEAVGPPVTTNSGLTYVMASGLSTQSSTAAASPNPGGLNQGYMTVLMAFTTSPTITLTLPIPFEATYGAQVAQVNPLETGTTISATATPTNSPLLLDAARGQVTIQNFNVAGGQFSASQSFVVTVTPVGQSTPVTFVVHPIPQGALPVAGNSFGVATADSGGYTPLQWYYVLPGIPRSAPTLIGDYLFFTLTDTLPNSPTLGQTFVVAVDANPQATDATVRPGFGEPLKDVVNTLITPGPNGASATSSPTDHVHWLQSLNNNQTTTAYAPPVGSQGVLAVNSSSGTFAYQDQPTLIADGKRLLEVAPGSDATWALNASQLNVIVGGDLPVYGDNGTILNGNPSGATLSVSRSLSHPSIARKIPQSSDYLIADTGNNRVVRVGRSGAITWKLDKLSNDYNILGGGDPITLSGPTDVQYYQTYTLDANNNVAGYEVHYIVADPGNYRIVEVADYFDTKGNPASLPHAPSSVPAANLPTAGKHEVVWTTRTQSQQGRSLRYTALQRYLGADPTGQYTGYPYIVATVSNSSVGGIVSTGNGSGVDTTGGALVSLHYAPYATTLAVNLLSNGAQSTVTPWPAAATTAVSTEPVADGTVLAAADDIRETRGMGTFGPSGQSTPTAGNESSFTVRRLQRPTSFTQLNLFSTPSAAANTPVQPRTIYLICDIGVVYAVEATSDTTPAGAPNNGPLAVRNVLWKFTQADYDVMNITRLASILPAGQLQQTPITPDLLPRFAPSSIQLLPNGDFLIANAYQGPNSLFQSGQFNGEVFQVTPKLQPGSFNGTTFTPVATGVGNAFSLYTALSSTVTAEGGILDSFASPLLQLAPTAQTATGTPGSFLTTVVGSLLQAMGGSNNTNLLEQPLFAIRP